MGDVERFLAGLGLSKHLASFERHRIDMSLLPTLTAEDLREIGVELVGERRRLLNAAAALGQGAPLTGAAPVAAEPTEPVARPSERRHLTVFMADMVGSTELVVRLDPEDAREVLAAFRVLCSDIVRRFGGRIANVLGDGVVACFGYPQAVGNDAELAVRAGLELQRRLARQGRGRGDPGGIGPGQGRDEGRGDGPAARVALASGLVVVGEAEAAGDAFDQAMVGETPNLAARLLTIARPGAVVCSNETRALAGGIFDYEDIGGFALRGFPEAVQAWRVIDERRIESRFTAIHVQAPMRMIGRVNELSILVERWQTALSGEGQFAVIAGEAGIGKSRLLQAFIDNIADEPHFRVAFQAAPYFEDSAFYPIIRQIEFSSGILPGDSIEEKRRKLTERIAAIPGSLRHLAQFMTLLSLDDAPQPGESPERVRSGILDALVGRFAEMSAIRPVLCVLEDAHWSDPSTQDFIERLLERLQRLRMLVVVTTRLEFDAPWLHHPLVTHLRLGRLTRAQSVALAREVLAGRSVDAAAIEALVERTDGIPLYLEELTRAMVEAGSGERSEAEDEADPAEAVPLTLQETLLARLDRDPTAKRVAQVASVIGRDFTRTLLAGIVEGLADLDQAGLSRGLASLIEARIVTRESLPDDEHYSFKHGLLRQVAYSTLLNRRRQELHRRIAEVLETRMPDIAQNRPELLALHLTRAGLVERGADMWLAAGKRALSQGAYDEALSHLRSGLAQVAGEPQHLARELPLQVALVEALRAARFTSGEDALNACRRARELAEAADDFDTLIRTLRLELGINFNRPDMAAVAAVADNFARVAAERGSAIAGAMAAQARGFVAMFSGDLAAADRHFATALEARREIPDTRHLASLQFPISSLTYKAWVDALLARPEAARRSLAESVAVASRGTTFAQSLTLANTVLIHHVMRTTDEARPLLARLGELAAERGSRYWVELVGFHEGWLRAGASGAAALEAGVGAMRRAIASFRDNAVEVELPFYVGLLGERLAQAGRFDEAEAVLEEALAHAARTAERWHLPELLRLRAVARHAQGRDGTGDLDAAARAAASQGSRLFAVRIAVTALDFAETGAPGPEPAETARARLAALMAQVDDPSAPAGESPDLAEARARLLPAPVAAGRQAAGAPGAGPAR